MVDLKYLVEWFDLIEKEKVLCSNLLFGYNMARVSTLINIVDITTFVVQN